VLPGIAGMTSMLYYVQPLVEMESYELFALLTLNQYPPNLCIPSSQDYKLEPLGLSQFYDFFVSEILWEIIVRIIMRPFLKISQIQYFYEYIQILRSNIYSYLL
jgi:hypothetical protein